MNSIHSSKPSKDPEIHLIKLERFHKMYSGVHWGGGTQKKASHPVASTKSAFTRSLIKPCSKSTQIKTQRVIRGAWQH